MAHTMREAPRRVSPAAKIPGMLVRCAIFGQTLAGPMDGHEPIMPVSLRHYDLHVWRWKDNPRGMFTSTNAKLKCTRGSPYTIAMGMDHKKHEGKH